MLGLGFHSPVHRSYCKFFAAGLLISCSLNSAIVAYFSTFEPFPEVIAILVCLTGLGVTLFILWNYLPETVADPWPITAKESAYLHRLFGDQP